MNSRVVSISEQAPPRFAEVAVDLVFPVVCFLLVSVICAWAWATNRRPE